uniref:Uncharacterized protein n=1 Tax=Hemiselmis tepida TaxID=464990 RepID=A0A7S0VSU5_9CRYP|mmetsp:Transcript_20472/g.51707  ORF Transcript_20472/g.51707 Transcript_20472/m.51707 type:complete len:215 (+) Transcript_20472:19-663(+)
MPPSAFPSMSALVALLCLQGAAGFLGAPTPLLTRGVAAPQSAFLGRCGLTLRAASSRPGAGAARGAGVGMGSLRMDLDAEMREAAEFGFAGKVEQLVKAGADVNSRDSDDLDKTAIHKAAFQGHIEAVSTLIDLGADPNLGTETGSTALHFAAAYGHLGLVDCLLKKGADPTVLNCDNESPLDMGKMKGRYSDRVDFVTIVKVLQEATDNWKKK